MRAVSSCANAATLSARARPRRAPRAIAAAIASSRVIGVCAVATSAAANNAHAAGSNVNGLGITSPIYVRRDADCARGERVNLQVGTAGATEQPAVDAIAGVRVIEANGLEAGEDTDGRAHDDVARPVLVVIHARY